MFEEWRGSEFRRAMAEGGNGHLVLMKVTIGVGVVGARVSIRMGGGALDRTEARYGLSTDMRADSDRINIPSSLQGSFRILKDAQSFGMRGIGVIHPRVTNLNTDGLIGSTTQR